MESKSGDRTLYFAGVSLAVGFFLFAGTLMLPLLGLEYDEVLFVRPLVSREGALWYADIFKRQVPLMLMTYVGALKTWLFAPLFHIFGYRVSTVRVPTLIGAAITLLLLGELIGRIAGRRAGLIAIGLLATDAVFLTTAVFDWGPVVLQNLLLVSGLLCVVVWLGRPSRWLLFASALIFGLALWDKAIFVWNLTGMAVAAMVLQGAGIRRVLGPRDAAMLMLGLTMGAFPLVYANAAHQGQIVAETAHFSAAEIPKKAEYLALALEGGITAGAFIDWRYPIADHVPRRFVEISHWFAGRLDRQFSSGRFWLFIVSIPLGIFCATGRRRRWIVFFALSAAIAWMQIAITINAGGSFHHSVLIWPFVYAAVAIACAEVARRLGRFETVVLIVVMTCFAARGIAQINFTYSSLASFSPITSWTNADASLAGYLEQNGIHTVATPDWGIATPLMFRSRGKISVNEIAVDDFGSIESNLTASKGKSDSAIVLHTDSRQIFPNVNGVIKESLSRHNLTWHVLGEVSDSHGIPTFQVLQVE